MSYLSSNKRLARNTLFMSIRMVIVLLISLYTTRIVLQELGVVDYGVYNVVCGFVAMFAFFNTSMSNGIQRFFNYELGKNGEDGANKVYCTAVLIQVILAILIVVFVEICGLWYLHNKMVIPAERLHAAELIFQFSIITFLLGILQAPYIAAVIAHERLDFYAVLNIVDVLLKLGAVFMLKTVMSDKLIMYGLMLTVIVFLDLMVYYVYCKINFKEIHYVKRIEKDLLKKMIGFSGWNLFGSFSLVMENQGINLVMNYFYGPVVNAARGVANQVNGGVQSFVQNITMPVRPQVTQSYAQGDLFRTMSLTYSVSKISSAFLLLMAIPASIEIDYVLRLWLGENIPDHTAFFTVIILLTSLINNLNAATSGVVHATGEMRDYQLWGSIIRVSSVVFAFFLIKEFDIPELGLVAVLLCASIAHAVGLVIVKKLVGLYIRDYLKKVVFPVLIVLFVSTIIAYAVHLLMAEGFLRLIIVIFVSLVSVCLLCFYVAFEENERVLSIQLLKPVISFMKKK
jgi:O-antigen/teichoic acid export membrane protein